MHDSTCVDDAQNFCISALETLQIQVQPTRIVAVDLLLTLPLAHSRPCPVQADMHANLGGGEQVPASASRSHSYGTAGPGQNLAHHPQQQQQQQQQRQGSVQSLPQQQSAFAAPEQQAAALQQQGSLTSSLQGAGSLSQSSTAPPPTGRNASLKVTSRC